MFNTSGNMIDAANQNDEQDSSHHERERARSRSRIDDLFAHVDALQAADDTINSSNVVVNDLQQ